MKHSPTGQQEPVNTPAAWLAKQSAIAKAQISAVIVKDEADLAGLPVWARTSTTKTTRPKTQIVDGAAILPHATTPDKYIPRVEGWRKICDRIVSRLLRATFPGEGCEIISRPGKFLADVAFQHHHSTNGRWNPELGRWERWGVRSAAEWAERANRIILKIEEDGSRTTYAETVSLRTFHRLKDRLISLGLIVAEAHKWQGVTCLWIKPTAKLCEMLFQPGAWDEGLLFGDKKKAASPVDKAKKKPRGISAKAVDLKSDMASLYKLYRSDCYQTVMAEAAKQLDEEERFQIYWTLTEPYPLTQTRSLRPFLPEGSKRRRSLAVGLGLAWDAKTGSPKGVK